MTDQAAKDKVTTAFARICQAKTINDLESLADELQILPRNRLNPIQYPPIKYKIPVLDIEQLKEAGLLNKDNTFSTNLSSENLDPITKLLYAIVWKNGDIRKVKHIVEGILDCENPSDDREEGVVFHQFGKYLSGTPCEPIIDQHVLRAFSVYRATTPEEIHKARNISTLSKRNNALIKAYIEWMKSGDDIQKSLRETEGYTFHLDKLLFGIGKTIKINKRSLELV
jgi:hypothetical protein